MVVEKPVKETIVVSVDGRTASGINHLAPIILRGMQLGDPHWIGMLENAGSPHGPTKPFYWSPGVYGYSFK